MVELESLELPIVSAGDRPTKEEVENVIEASVRKSIKGARGHGKGGKPQWFKFLSRLGGGYDLASGVKVEGPPPSFLNKAKK